MNKQLKFSKEMLNGSVELTRDMSDYDSYGVIIRATKYEVEYSFSFNENRTVKSVLIVGRIPIVTYIATVMLDLGEVKEVENLDEEMTYAISIDKCKEGVILDAKTIAKLNTDSYKEELLGNLSVALDEKDYEGDSDKVLELISVLVEII